jgi:hypothetical protein
MPGLIDGGTWSLLMIIEKGEKLGRKISIRNGEGRNLSQVIYFYLNTLNCQD